MPWGWYGGYVDELPSVPKIGHPQRDRSKAKASRKANRQRRS